MACIKFSIHSGGSDEIGLGIGPTDVGEAAAFLASDSAEWITGSILAVDGGLTTN